MQSWFEACRRMVFDKWTNESFQRTYKVVVVNVRVFFPTHLVACNPAMNSMTWSAVTKPSVERSTSWYKRSGTWNAKKERKNTILVTSSLSISYFIPFKIWGLAVFACSLSSHLFVPIIAFPFRSVPSRPVPSRPVPTAVPPPQIGASYPEASSTSITTTLPTYRYIQFKMQ